MSVTITTVDNEIAKFLLFLSMFQKLLCEQKNRKFDGIKLFLNKKLFSEEILDSILSNTHNLIKIPLMENNIASEAMKEKDENLFNFLMNELLIWRAQNLKIYLSITEKLTRRKINYEPFLIHRAIQLVLEDILDYEKDKINKSVNIIELILSHNPYSELKNYLINMAKNFLSRLSAYNQTQYEFLVTNSSSLIEQINTLELDEYLKFKA